MKVLHVISCLIFLLTVKATPEIPSKGKHMHMGDKSQTSLEDADMPRFAEPVANVTVSVGRDALLACVIENLKGYKVAWVRMDTQTILSIHHNVISQNNRISLTYNDHRSWYLHIKEVEESDRGWYMCQVNTDPMRSRKGYLQVVVPPMIVEGMTSNDLVVREGLNVTLMCKARGYPEPYVMWRREDGEEMLISGERVNVVDGELLHITKVSRLHMAAYLCVASNGVPPSISKRVNLRVQFPPMLSIPNQLEGAYIGQDVVLECHTEAYPASINYWTTERGDMIISDTSRAGDKYETTSTINGYTKYMKLKIRKVGPNDFGTYRCVAKNSLGETDGNIKLDEMPAPTNGILSEIAMLNRSLGTMFSRKNGRRRNKNKLDSNSLPDYGVEEWRDGAGNAGDNNQAPVRNPPDAFHNSAGALAQHNLVGIIIQAIKMQSLGIFKRLTNFVQTINDNEMLQNIKAVIPTKTAIRKTIHRYVHKIQKRTATLNRVLVEMIKSVFIWRQQHHQQQQQQQWQLEKRKFFKNLIIENENEYKTSKHFSTQETHVSRHEKKYCKIWRRILRKTHHLFIWHTKTKMLNKHPTYSNSYTNFFIQNLCGNEDFQRHIKQQEILHKFNTIFVTNNKHHKNQSNNNNFNSIKFFANTFYWLIILPLTILTLSFIVKYLLKSLRNPLTFLTKSYNARLNHLIHDLFLKCLNANINKICWHIFHMLRIVMKILTSVHSKFILYLNSRRIPTPTPTPIPTPQTFSTVETATTVPSTSSSLSTALSPASSFSVTVTASTTLSYSTLSFCR